MQFEYWKSGEDKQWYVALMGANGESLLVSEGYHNRKDMFECVYLARAAGDAPLVRRKKAK